MNIFSSANYIFQCLRVTHFLLNYVSTIDGTDHISIPLSSSISNINKFEQRMSRNNRLALSRNIKSEQNYKHLSTCLVEPIYIVFRNCRCIDCRLARPVFRKLFVFEVH